MQHDDGHWPTSVAGDDEIPKEAKGHAAGVTGLALVALLRDGNTPSAGPHRDQVAAGLRYLLALQAGQGGALRSTYAGVEDGRAVAYYSSLWNYDQAVGTWALSEALQRDPTPRLRAGTERAVEVLLAAKNPDGVWRYAIPPDGTNDTSVTQWAVRALVAAERAGIEVDPAYRAHGLEWVDAMTDSGTGRVGYVETGSPSSRVPGINDHAPVEKGEALTACGYLIRAWLGQTAEVSPAMEDHVELIATTLPSWDVETHGVDFYYWLMGSETMEHAGGRLRDVWTEALDATLLDSQRTDGDAAGSWDPVGTWCFAGGRVYATAMAALALTAERSFPRSR